MNIIQKILISLKLIEQNTAPINHRHSVNDIDGLEGLPGGGNDEDLRNDFESYKDSNDKSVKELQSKTFQRVEIDEENSERRLVYDFDENNKLPNVIVNTTVVDDYNINSQESKVYPGKIEISSVGRYGVITSLLNSNALSFNKNDKSIGDSSQTFSELTKNNLYFKNKSVVGSFSSSGLRIAKYKNENVGNTSNILNEIVVQSNQIITYNTLEDGTTTYAKVEPGSISLTDTVTKKIVKLTIENGVIKIK